MQNIYDKVRTLSQSCVNLILPPLCVVSGKVVERQGMIAPDAWWNLRFIGDPACSCCGIPFDYKIEEAMQCADCLARPPEYDRARAALVYDEGSKPVILGFKHADKTHNLRAFSPWLAQAGADLLQGADYVMPVPLHFWRLVRRRYNQAALLARDVGERSGVPCLTQALLRARPTKSQGHMRFAERRKNVSGAFMVDPAYAERLNGAHIVLVDDVYTTGATVNECARVLKKAGAARVDVLTIARVVKEGMV